jgi:hypothetical protein
MSDLVGTSKVYQRPSSPPLPWARALADDGVSGSGMEAMRTLHAPRPQMALAFHHFG